MKRRQQTKRILVALWLTGDPGRRKLGGLLRYIAEHSLPWQLQFIRIQEDFSAEFVASCPERGIDGIVYSLPNAKSGAPELAKLTIPTVALDMYDESLPLERTRNLVYIAGSTDATGREAARHLLSQGIYRSFGFVADTSGSTWGRLRGEAFVSEMKANGFSVSSYRVRHKRYDLPHLADWISKLQKPAAIFVANDDRALYVLDACHKAMLSIPDDVAVVGVDNDEMLCANSTPSLTSIQPDHDKIGYLAAEQLDVMINGRELKQPEHILVGIKGICVRESTSPVSNSGRLVMRALAFIRENAAQAIKPKDVATHLHISRSLIDLRFRELQNETVGKAIQRYRLEEVCRRLADTNDTIDDIAIACAFAKRSRLNAAFKNQYGCTMTEFRKARRSRPQT